MWACPVLTGGRGAGVRRRDVDAEDSSYHSGPVSRRGKVMKREKRGEHDRVERSGQVWSRKMPWELC
jgi:hypothetical protein